MRPLGTLLVLALAGACGAAGQDEAPPEPEAATDATWSSRDINCASTADCAGDEACVEGVCQMERCRGGPYDSAPPLGEGRRFFEDRDLVAVGAPQADGTHWIDGYLSDLGGVSYAEISWRIGDGDVVDIAGGLVTPSGPERPVAAVRGRSEIYIGGSADPDALEVGFEPVALATGDLRGDGVDEILALGGDGRFAVCRAAAGSCSNRELGDDFTGWDIATGDIDGDGSTEVVVMGELPSAPSSTSLGSSCGRTSPAMTARLPASASPPRPPTAASRRAI